MQGSTIAAIASPPGPGERGVIRVSGPAAAAVARVTCRVAGKPLEPGARGLHEGRFEDGRGSQPCLVLWMPGPGSYTGEDVLELHLPGSPPLLRAALERVLACGAEPARPGEFTRRAFLSGRIDLTRAEGVLELVFARTRAERRAATALLVGGLDERTRELRDGLEELRALCEASLDFDEGDAIDVPREQLEGLMGELAGRIEGALAWERERVAGEGAPVVALAGEPNAGKSSLFNRLVPEEGQRALVSDVAGTTRDALGAACELDGLAVELQDLAGIDRGARGLEARAQERADLGRATADLVLWVVDGAADHDPRRVEREVAEILERDQPRLLVWNKTDLAPRVPRGWLGISAARGEGLDELARRSAELLRRSAAGARRELAARHRYGLEQAREGLARAREGFELGLPLDLVAEHLREASAALDLVHGRTTPEDLLDRIFARFCLGK